MNRRHPGARIDARRRGGRATTIAAIATAAVGLAGAMAQASGSLESVDDGVIRADGNGLERVHWDEPGPDGHLRGGVLWLPRPEWIGADAEGDPPAVTTIHGGGDPDLRLDIVFVGDGYTEDQLDQYAADCDALAASLLAEPPFDRYAPLISIHRVDVISAESGVDHDPEFGILRDTALDMGFWCANIERLLCVNTAKATIFAGQAPGRDLVIAVANSDSYGGAGYDGVATASAGHVDSPEIMIHEIGHSLADLADEYFSPGVYEGPEPPHRNVSRLDAEAMAASGEKWARWLDDPAPGADGPITTFEGAFLFAEGVHRPSVDSKMRSLHRPFNPPSREAIVLAIHEPIRTIAAATPDGTLPGDAIIFVDPVPVAGPPAEVSWIVAGELLPGTDATTLDVSAHGPPSGTFTVRAIVTDATTYVRDETARSAVMREDRMWTVERTTTCAGDLDNDSMVGALDMILLLSNWGCAGCVGDVDADGSVGLLDLIHLLQAWGSC